MRYDYNPNDEIFAELQAQSLEDSNSLDDCDYDYEDSEDDEEEE